MDSRSAPERVCGGHRPDECGDLGADEWAAAGPTRKAGPVLAEASPLPSQDGIRGHDDQSLTPAGPESGQGGPEQTVGRAKLRAGRQALVDSELLAQGEVLEGKLAMPAEEEGEEPKQVEQNSDHRA